MKLLLLALLCVGTAAFGQTPAPQKVDPDQLFEMPKKFIQPAPPGLRSFRPLPPMKNSLVLPRLTTLPPRPNLNSPQIDPKIIVHPPWHSQSKGKDLSRHLYPNLKFMPLHHGPQIPR